ncbi:MAG: hypothetical protein Q7R80_01815, partial [bacterium]|nr:hypothetical protein [bacterium]
MRILLFLSTIVAIATPTRADADSCPRGYEAVPQYIPSTFDGIQWRVCAPITDAKSCQSIDAFEVCEHGFDFIIFSHLAACRQRVDVLNERCEAGKALEHHLAVMEEACGTGRSYV